MLFLLQFAEMNLGCWSYQQLIKVFIKNNSSDNTSSFPNYITAAFFFLGGGANVSIFTLELKQNKTQSYLKFWKQYFILKLWAQLGIHSSNFWAALVKHFLIVYIHNFLLLTIKLQHPNISNAPSDPLNPFLAIYVKYIWDILTKLD